MGRIWLFWGCVFGFLSVGLGAFLQHGLAHSLDAQRMGWIQTANTYIAYHVPALLALGLWSHWEKWASSFAPGLFFVVGIFLFSGSLYGLALAQLDFMVFVTPVGGVCLLLGWVTFALSIWRAQSPLL